MIKEKTIPVGGRQLSAKELTPRQIDALLSISPDSQTAPALNALLDSPLSADVVMAATGLSADELLDAFTLEELQTIWGAVEEVNDFLLQRLSGALERLIPHLAKKS